HVADGRGGGGRVLDGPVEVDLAENIVLLDVGQQVGGPAPARCRVGGPVAVRACGPVAGRQGLVSVVVVVQAQADLVEVVAALDAGGGRADVLHGGHQRPEENGTDGDDGEQHDHREGAWAGSSN